MRGRPSGASCEIHIPRVLLVTACHSHVTSPHPAGLVSVLKNRVWEALPRQSALEAGRGSGPRAPEAGASLTPRRRSAFPGHQAGQVMGRPRPRESTGCGHSRPRLGWIVTRGSTRVSPGREVTWSQEVT